MSACPAPAAPAPSKAPGNAHPTAASPIDGLSWMVGDWGSVDSGTLSEEHWIAARGNTMLGTARATKGDKTFFFEFLRIEVTGGLVTYWGAPLGKEATPFRMVALQGQRAVFENLAHDYPQRILYWRDGERLNARVEGQENGVDKGSEWKWERLQHDLR